MEQAIRPHIGVRFQTGASGEPEFVDGGDHRHYKIVMEVEDLPGDVYAATFELHPTYYDPIRTLRPNNDGHVALKTTTFGDYDIKVRLRTKYGEERIRGNLLSALRRSCKERGLSNPAVIDALEAIARN